MSGAMRKVGVYLGLLEDADHYDDYASSQAGHGGHDYDEYDARAHDRAEKESRKQAKAQQRRAATGNHAPAGNVSKLSDRRPMAVPTRQLDLSRITTLHPTTYNEARTVGENFREGVPVIMNLTGMTDDDAKRLVDFAAGLVFAVQGTLERVTSKVFLVSPPHVSVATIEQHAEPDFAGYAD